MNIVLKTTTVVLLVLSLNLQWVLLQTVAWTGMIVSYSQVNSFTEALRMTFDGKHPCPLCKVVEAGRDEAKDQEQQKAKLLKKGELALIWQPLEFDFKCQTEPIPAPDVFADARGDAPPKPRPRGLFPDNPARACDALIPG